MVQLTQLDDTFFNIFVQCENARAAVSHSEIRAGQVVRPGAFSGSAARTSLRLAGSRTREKIFFIFEPVTARNRISAI
jgi:hypothetical protein